MSTDTYFQNLDRIRATPLAELTTDDLIYTLRRSSNVLTDMEKARDEAICRILERLCT